MFWKLALIFGIFLLIDVLGHISLDKKRGVVEWLLFIILVTSGVVTLVLGGVENYRKSEENGEAFYMAYKYIEEGKMEDARGELVKVKGKYEKDAKLLEIFSNVMEGDYLKGYFQSEQLMEDVTVSSRNKRYIRKLRILCRNALGIENKGDFGKKNLQELLDDYVESVNFSDKQIKKYSKKYEIDREVNLMDMDAITKRDIDEIRKKYGDDEVVMQFACRYYVYNRDYVNAENTAKVLVEKYDNETNYIIYSDILAQRVYESDEKDYGKIDKAIRYITSKCPSYGDVTGLYSMQLAKLYMVKGEISRANKFIDSIIESSVDIDEESHIKTYVDEVVKSYRRFEATGGTRELEYEAARLIESQSSGVVPLEGDTVNGIFCDYIIRYLEGEDCEVTEGDTGHEINGEETIVIDESGRIERVNEDTFAISAVNTKKIINVSNETEAEIIISGIGFEDNMEVCVGDRPISDIEIEGDTIRGKLSGDFERDFHDIIIKKTDGSMAVGNNMLNVSVMGGISAVKLGCAIIMADDIIRLGDVYSASGNVMINGSICSEGNVEIEVWDSDIYGETHESSYVIGKSGRIISETGFYMDSADVGGNSAEIQGNLREEYIKKERGKVISITETDIIFED